MPPDRNVLITVVLPAYNEESNLPALLDRLNAVLSDSRLGTKDRYQIIVVDDGSTDGTARIAQAASLLHPVVLVRHETNQGLGGALRTGLTEASRSDGVVVTMDSDNSHDPAYIPELLRVMDAGYDVAIASRFQTGGAMIGVPVHRQFLSLGASALMTLLFRYEGVRDYSTGYRAYRGSVLKDLHDTHGTEMIRQPGFASMVEVLIKLRNIDASVQEVPFVLRYDQKIGVSKMNIPHTIRGYLNVVGECWRQPSESRGMFRSVPERGPLKKSAQHSTTLSADLPSP